MNGVPFLSRPVYKRTLKCKAHQTAEFVRCLFILVPSIKKERAEY